MMRKIASILLVFLLLPLLLLCSCDKTDGDIFFMVDGEIYASFLEDGYPADPTKEGYVFAGWYFDEGTWEQPFELEYNFAGNQIANAQIIPLRPGESAKADADSAIVDRVEVGSSEYIYQYSQITTSEGGSYIIGDGNSNVYHVESYVVTKKVDFNSGLSESIYVYAKFVKATEK